MLKDEIRAIKVLILAQLQRATHLLAGIRGHGRFATFPTDVLSILWQFKGDRHDTAITARGSLAVERLDLVKALGGLSIPGNAFGAYQSR